HYIIHSYDHPELAARGAIAAARCAQLAPSAPHALHMPSHIFATLGMWHEVIRSDLASDAETIAYAARSADTADLARNSVRYHSLDFLVNAYLQLAQDDKARSIVDIGRGFAESEFPSGIRYSMHTGFAAVPVRYAFERGAWAEAASLPIART